MSEGTPVAVGDHLDLPAIVGELNELLRLRTTPIGMKRFASEEEMAAIPRLRRPQAIYTMDQIVGQAARLGWTVGVTAADLVGDQCAAVLGLHPRDDEWLSGRRYAGVWYATDADAAAHQAAMDLPSHGSHSAVVVSPLASGRLDPPDICLIYATPAQMILFINGLQWTGTASSSGDASASRRAPTRGGGRWRPVSRACRSRASPSVATAASRTTSC